MKNYKYLEKSLVTQSRFKANAFCQLQGTHCSVASKKNISDFVSKILVHCSAQLALSVQHYA